LLAVVLVKGNYDTRDDFKLDRQKKNGEAGAPKFKGGEKDMTESVCISISVRVLLLTEVESAILP
jgi:hypothetical protein